jgi:hypothetical protein
VGAATGQRCNSASTASAATLGAGALKTASPGKPTPRWGLGTRFMAIIPIEAINPGQAIVSGRATHCSCLSHVVKHRATET